MATSEVPFTELLSKIVDNRGRTCPVVDAGFPLIATNCIRNDRLYPAFENIRYVSDETYKTWFRGHPEPGDMVFVCKGTPGRVCLTPDPVSFCIAQDMVAIRADPKKVYPRYLFALLRSPGVQNMIANMHVGTLIPHFKKGDFDKLLLPIPARAIQEEIGDMYFEMSALIDCNRRMNETLEATARALFKSWFIDFEPVRSKMEGRPPAYMDAATSALFPDSLCETDGALIPNGWQMLGFDEGASFLNGLALQKFPAADGEPFLPVIKIAQIRAGNSQGADRANLSVPASHRIDDGDLIFSWSGSLMVRIWVGGLGALNQHLFKVTSSTFPRWFIHGWLQHHLPEFQAIAADKATTMGHIQRHHLTEAKILTPSLEVIERASRIIAPLEEQFIQNDKESRIIRDLRDQLLSRLLSGELQVRSAERSVEAAV